MRVIKVGCIYVPLLANVAFAATISNTEISGVPKAIDGTASIGAVMPKRRTKLITASGPNCFITQAVT